MQAKLLQSAQNTKCIVQDPIGGVQSQPSALAWKEILSFLR